MSQVEAHCGLLDARQRTDILSELKAHLLESFVRLNNGDEVQSLSTAVERLGQPDEFVPLWVEERLLDGAQPGSGIRSLFSLIRTNALKGVRQFFASMVVGFGYLLSFYFFLMAIMKLIYPDNVGLYLTPGGIPILGYVDADEFTEVMGAWLTPVGLVSAVVLQFLLARVVRRWTHHSRR